MTNALSEEETKVFAISVGGIDPDLSIQDFLHHFDPNIQKKIIAFKSVQLQRISLFSHLLVRFLFKQIEVSKNEVTSYSYGQYGKPKIHNARNLEFNVSHSGSWIVCAISTETIGIDIEKHKPVQLGELDIILSQEEKQWLEATSLQSKPSLFYDIWTAKESYLKALGGGLYESVSLENITVRPQGKDYILSIEGQSVENWKFQKYSIDSNYSMTACYRSKKIKKEVTFIPIADVIKDTLSSNY